MSHGPEKVRCDRLKVGLKESKPATDGSCVWVPSLSRGRQKVKSLTGLVKDASVSRSVVVQQLETSGFGGGGFAEADPLGAGSSRACINLAGRTNECCTGRGLASISVDSALALLCLNTGGKNCGTLMSAGKGTFSFPTRGR